MRLTRATIKNYWQHLRLHPRRLGLISGAFILAFSLMGFLSWVGVSRAGFFEDKAVAVFANFIIGIMYVIASLCFKLVFFLMDLLINVAQYNGYLYVKAVTVGWVVLRDVGNIFLVIVLLVIAIATIIGAESYEWRKMLTKFVFAAVLINFSRQICAFIIDAAQVVVMTFVNGISGTISGNILQAFNLNNAFTMSTNAQVTAGITIEQQATTSVMTAILAVILVVTFAIYALIMVMRMVMLWVLIVLSPMAFFLSVLPQTQKYASQWWSEFASNVIMGPVIIFFLWLSLVTLTGGNIGTQVVTASNPNTAQTNAAVGLGLTGLLDWSTLTSFVIGIGMLLAGIKVGQQIGGAGAGALGSLQGAIKKTAMTLSGASAAMYLGKGAASLGVKGVKATAMNIPLVGGKSWVRRGQSAAALAGYAWGRVSGGRNKMGEALDKARDKAAKASNYTSTAGILNKVKSWGLSLAARGVESGARADKRVKKLVQANEAQKEIVESASMSGTAEGQFSTRVKTVSEAVKARAVQKEGRNAAEARSELISREHAWYAEQGKLAEWEQKLAAASDPTEKAKIQIEIDESRKRVKEKEQLVRDFEHSEMGGGIFGDKFGILFGEQTAKLDKEAYEKRAEIGAGNLRREAYDTTLHQSKAFKTTDPRVTGTRLGAVTDFAEEASFISEGTRTKEEGLLQKKQRERIEREDKRLAEEAAKVGGDLKTTRDARDYLASGGDPALLKQEHDGYLKQKDDKEKERAALDQEMNNDAGRLEFLNNEQDLQKRNESKQEREELQKKQQERSDKKASLNTEIDELDKKAKGVELALSAVDEKVEPAKLNNLVDQLIAAVGDKDKKKVIVDNVNNGGDLSKAFSVLFGNQNVQKKIDDMNSKDALDKIKKAITDNASKIQNMKGSEARSDLSASLQQTISKIQPEIQKTMEKLVEDLGKTMPSVFANASTALRDEQYSLYRGRKAEAVDKASQLLVWDKHGIDTPSNAGQEIVGEEYYNKIFKGMDYNQILKTLRDFQSKMAEKGRNGQSATFQESAIAQAIMFKLKSESWVDDAGSVINARSVADAEIKKLKESGVFGEDTFTAMERSANSRGANQAPNLNADQIEGLGAFLKGASGKLGFNATTIINDIAKKGDASGLRSIEESLKREIRQDITMGAMGVHSLDKLINVIKELERVGASDKLIKHST